MNSVSLNIEFHTKLFCDKYYINLLKISDIWTEINVFNKIVEFYLTVCVITTKRGIHNLESSWFI